MLLAAAIAVVAVALGLGLGLVPAGRTRLSGPLRTFALSAALTVVFLHLLPEAFSEIGVPALFLFAATSVVPAWTLLVRGFLGTHRHGSGVVHGGLVAGYVGLLVHHVGDGLGLGAYAALPGGARAHADVMVALAVHTVPLVAVVAFAFQRDGGPGRAVRGAAGLAGASVIGVLVSGIAPGATVADYSAWVAALVAGLLVHVVTHDLGRDLPASLGARALDALAVVGGVATSLVGGEHAAGNHAGAFIAAGAGIMMTLSAPVLAGWVLASLAMRGKPSGVRRALEAAFGSSLALDGAVLALFIGGITHALLYAAGALLVARAVRTLSPKDEDARAPAAAPPVPWLVRLDDFASESVPWIFAAFAFFALLRSSFPGPALEGLSAPVALALAVVVALPLRIPPAAAILIATALERAGLPFEAALVFALLAPAPGAEELAKIAHRSNARAAVWLAVGLVLAALAPFVLALVAESVAPGIAPLFPSFTSRLALLVVLALALRAAFERGLRGLLLHIFHSHDTASPPADAKELPPVRPEAASATGGH